MKKLDVLKGKTIKNAKFDLSDPYGPQLQIDFTDGTDLYIVFEYKMRAAINLNYGLNGNSVTARRFQKAK